MINELFKQINNMLSLLHILRHEKRFTDKIDIDM